MSGYAPEIVLSDEHYYRENFIGGGQLIEACTDNERGNGHDRKAPRKVTIRSHRVDGANYMGGDSGCAWATRKLGYQSSCLSCPFDSCGK